MPSSAVNEATRREWRKLGFYYERDDATRTWRLLGTRQGLLGFAALLKEYAGDENKRQMTEHEHFGPYWYLEVGTWSEPEITEHWIAGPLDAIAALADRVEGELSTAKCPAVLKFRDVYAPSSPYEFQIELQPDTFDPAVADSACNE